MKLMSKGKCTIGDKINCQHSIAYLFFFQKSFNMLNTFPCPLEEVSLYIDNLVLLISFDYFNSKSLEQVYFSTEYLISMSVNLLLET